MSGRSATGGSVTPATRAPAGNHRIQPPTSVRTSNGGANWTPQNSQTTNNLNAVDLYSATQAVAVGAGGVLTVLNAGSWTTNSSGTTNNLNDVIFIPSLSDGLAIGDGGVARRASAPSGVWNASGTPAITENLYGIDVAASLSPTGYEVGGNGLIRRTGNLGSWSTETSTTTQTLRDVDVIDGAVGWAVGTGGTIVHRHTSSLWTLQSNGTGTDDFYGVDAIPEPTTVAGIITFSMAALLRRRRAV
jgi:hypothetical protein